MELKERFSKLLKDNGVTSYEVSQRTGVSQSTLSRILNGGTLKLSMKNADILAKYFHVNDEWLLSGQGERLRKHPYEKNKALEISGEVSPRANVVHLYDVSAAAGYGSFDEMISNERIVDTFIIPTFKDISWMIFVKGSSMYPKYSSGDIIACRVLYESRFIQWGKVYVVATREQGLLVKRLEESDQSDCIKAVSDNPTYKPFDIPKDEVLGIALVIGVIRME